MWLRIALRAGGLDRKCRTLFDGIAAQAGDEGGRHTEKFSSQFDSLKVAI
jgi:hypothetical protein